MMKQIIFSLALALTFSAHALEVVGDTVVLSAEEKANLPKCAEQGGCHLVSRAMVENYVSAVVQNYMQAVQVSFDQAVVTEAAKVCKNRI